MVIFQYSMQTCLNKDFVNFPPQSPKNHRKQSNRFFSSNNDNNYLFTECNISRPKHIRAYLKRLTNSN
uniref:Uncharacterized protein n=1 Tax=Anguilla anguilla TaxID=7936 RepID=A0A0E9QAH9_ANGAN